MENRKAPVSRDQAGKPAASPKSEIDTFLERARTLAPSTEGRGRLIFALDATMSRQPTWDTACKLQAEMFAEAGKVGGLDVQLVYFRGFNECRASKWVSAPQALRDLMTGIDCRGGHTQIGKVLAHARQETARKDANWAGPNIPSTGYAFAALVFWLFCFGMSRYSIYTERRLRTGHRR